MTLRTDIEQLLESANAAAAHARTSWVTFLLFATYLFITVGATTHVDLLLENPVTLPLFDVDLDLVTFYWVAPLFLLIYHLYTLVAHYILAGKLHAFNAALAAAPMDDAEREQQRRRVHPYVAAQSLAGPGYARLPAYAINFTMWLTLIVGPLLLLLAFQLRFLPYHHEAITWTHRAFLLCDLALAWVFWPQIRRPRATARAWVLRGRRVVRATGSAVLSLLIVFFAVGVATIPGEPVDRWLAGSTLAGSPLTVEVRGRPVFWPTKVLFEGRIDERTQMPDAPFSRNLVVINADVSELRPRLVLRNRDLRNAVFRFSRFSAADFSHAQLQGADLTGAQLQRASFTDAQLEGARLDDAQLASAQLVRSRLQGASLHRTRLEGADLSGARMQGADLMFAGLQGADLTRALLQGALLDSARLHGATLDGAELQGASLVQAQLQGALLRQTQLQGANLADAQLQGALLERAQLHGASIEGAGVWRASVPESRDAELLNARRVDSAALPGARQSQLQREAGGAIADAPTRDRVLARISFGFRPDAADRADQQRWLELASPAGRPDYGQRLVEFLGALACADSDAPWIAAGIARRAIRGLDGPPVSRAVAGRLIDPACHGAAGLDDDVKLSLHELAPP